MSNSAIAQSAPTFNHLENTKIYQGSHGWTGETKVKVKGKNWILSTLKRYNGTISTHCHVVEDCGGGNYSFTMFGRPDTEDFHLNTLPKGTKATEKTIKEAHFKALAEFDAKQENAELPDAAAEYKIEVGQVLFTDGPFEEKKRVIYEIDNTRHTPSYKTVFLDGSGFRIDTHIKNITQKFGIGVYYNEGEKISQDLIDDLVLVAYEFEKQEQAENAIKAASAQIKAEEKKAYLSQFQTADRRKTTNIIKAHILKTFPTVSKIEVKTDVFSGGDSMEVYYYAPAKIEALEDFIKTFKEGSFNSMEDIYEYDSTRGEIIMEGYILQTYKYCSSRHYEAAAPEPKPTTPAPKQTSTPATAAPVQKIEITGAFEILDYSDKAVAVFGDTKAIKEQLKSLGGRFNAYLTHPTTELKACGWVFPKNKREELENLLK